MPINGRNTMWMACGVVKLPIGHVRLVSQ